MTGKYTIGILTALLLLLSLAQNAQGSEQQWGIPYFENYTTAQYGGHNRNFDVECDGEGHVYIANFEGLLIYDYSQWQMIHTPGISRVTCLYQEKEEKEQEDGQERTRRIWFGGYNVLGYTENRGDSIAVTYVHSEDDVSVSFGEVRVIYMVDNTIHFLTNEVGSDHAYRVLDGKVHDDGTVRSGNALRHLIALQTRRPRAMANSKESYIVASHSGGIDVVSKGAGVVSSLDTSNGLCSDNITDLAYDGHGMVWGTTDNGIFRVALTGVYTRFGEMEGLKGQVQDIKEAYGTLYVGTLQGLFRLEQGCFTQIEAIDQACWQLQRTRDGKLVAATAMGLYIIGPGEVRKLSPRHTLSVYYMSDNTYYTGELDGIYDQNSHMVAKAPNVVKMQGDDKGGIWAISLYNETYYKAKGDNHFVNRKNHDMSLLFRYTDDKGRVWKARDNGLGLTTENHDAELQPWAMPFKDLSIQSMLLRDGIAWIGGNFGLIRWDTELALKEGMSLPQAYLRGFQASNDKVSCRVASDKIDPLGKTMMSYRLKDDEEWSAWVPLDDQGITLLHPTPGDYRLCMRIMDANGNIAQSKVRRFTILAPWYNRWWAQIIFALGLLLLASLGYMWRLHRAQVLREKLEKLVDERTTELKQAQNALLRQEREATIGKLTKGLIDRILNPMNYINNFSHLSLGLIKDLGEDLEDEKENMSEDNYEDAADIMQMMQTNLEKIEQHGLSTTRILKAMEEVLKERSRERVETDLCAICDKNIEMTMIYYAEHIRRSHVKCVWERPAEPITAVINADQISKVITALLGNSAYALTARKRKEEYDPVIGVRLEKDEEGHAVITIFDNGIGIEPGIIDKIFDPFFTTKPTAEAPGIGLYIAQQIIQDHGGTLTAKSEPLTLTEFTIRL